MGQRSVADGVRFRERNYHYGENPMIRVYESTASGGNQQHDLVELPPLAQTDGYEVLDGNPIASIRFDSGSVGTAHRLGVWHCTVGRFACTEKGDELQTILGGSLSLTGEDGVRLSFSSGDSFYTTKGERVVWEIHDDVTKVFFTHDADGTD